MTRLAFSGRQLALDILLIIGGIAFCWPLFAWSESGEIGLLDWSTLHYFDGCLRQSVIDCRELPLWNPYQLGGSPLWADYTARASVFSWFILGFGEVEGYRLEITAFYCLGLLGMFRYASRSGLRTPAALVATALFFLHPWLVGALTHCLADDLNLCLLPWLLLGYQRSLATGRLSALAVVVLASFIVNYAATHYFYASLFLAVIAGCAPGPRPRRIWVWAGTTVAALALGAIKWIPSLDLFTIQTRAIVGRTGMALGEVFDALAPFRGSSGWGIPFTAAIIGLILVGLVRLPSRFRFAPLTVLLFGLAAVGDRGFPWWQEITTRLPVIAELRTTQYALGYLAFTLALLAGIGVHRVLNGGRRPWLAGLFAIGVLGTLIPAGWSEQRPRWRAPRRAPLPVVETDRQGSQYARLVGIPFTHPTNRAIFQSLAAETSDPRYWREIAQYACLLNRIGVIEAFDPSLLGVVDEGEIPRVRFARAAGIGDPGYRGEHYLAEGEGDLQVARKTMNTFAYALVARGNAQVVVNQNWFPGWQVSIDGGAATPVRARDGLLAVMVPPGRHAIRFEYHPALASVGAAITALAAALLLALAIRDRCRSASRPAGAGAAAACGADRLRAGREDP